MTDPETEGRESAEPVRRLLLNLPPVKASPDFEERLWARLKSGGPVRRLVPVRTPALAYSLAALLVLAVASWYLLSRPPSLVGDADSGMKSAGRGSSPNTGLEMSRPAAKDAPAGSGLQNEQPLAPQGKIVRSDEAVNGAPQEASKRTAVQSGRTAPVQEPRTVTAAEGPSPSAAPASAGEGGPRTFQFKAMQRTMSMPPAFPETLRQGRPVIPESLKTDSTGRILRKSPEERP